MNENEEKIYDLIGSKSFAELTEDEKTLVLESLGSEELYEKMREANLAAEEVLSENAPPPPDMKASVMAVFDNKEEKRGFVWWKVAAAIAVLVVGAFVFWPSDNLEREPIAENIERKDSTNNKEQAPKEKQETQEFETEGEAVVEAFKGENEVLGEEAGNAIITSDEITKNTDDVLIAENQSAPIDEEIMEEDHTFADEAPVSDTPTAPEMEIEIAEDFEGTAEAKKDVQTKLARAQDLSADDADSQTINEFSMSNMKVETARSATTMQSDFNSEGASYEGISLKDIGGYKSKAYVAY
ncbi:MAG: choline kinase [Cryomorphaceae bacterium]|jgi:choline kinase